jgi:hypothetical protein
MGRVVSGWKPERVADYEACGVGLEDRTDSGLWGVWCRAESTKGSRIMGGCDVGLGAQTDGGLWGVCSQAGSTKGSRIPNQLEYTCWSDNLSPERSCSDRLRSAYHPRINQ